jgi:signal transduction histidine kinase/CheY-like chemotaxis protein
VATVLVVDDRAVNRKLVVMLLKQNGHRALEAADGAEALRVAHAEHPQLAISDILMPTMDGFEFVRQLRASPELAHTRTIFFTAHYHEREARALAQACGVSRVLVKPCPAAEILRAIEETLQGVEENATTPAMQDFDREHLRVMSDKLAEKVGQLTVVNRRLDALTQVNLQLASEREPQALLKGVCREARELLGAQYAVLCVLGGDQSQEVFSTTSGLGQDALAGLECPRIDDPVFARTLAERASLRLTNPGGDPRSAGLPRGYPAVHSVLAAPIASLGKTYGWICLLNKLGREDFDDDDERMLTSLASQVGRIYESDMLYLEMERGAGQLRDSELRFRQLATGLERRVVERTAELQAANEELAAFDYSISHDLRAPLNRIDGFCAMLGDKYGDKLDERGRDLLARIADAGRNMGQLVGDLFSLSTVARGELQRADVDLSALSEAIVATLRAAEPGRTVRFEAQAGMSARADPGLLRAVLENLLGNAWKFTRRNAAARIEVGCLRRGGELVYSVRDNGVGFDPANAEKLFTPFQRLHSHGDFEGTGIGLATVQRIVRRHGGRVWAEAAVDRGATFYFTLDP